MWCVAGMNVGPKNAELCVLLGVANISCRQEELPQTHLGCFQLQLHVDSSPCATNSLHGSRAKKPCCRGWCYWFSKKTNCLYCEMCVIHAVEWLLGFLTAHLKMCCEHCIVQLEHVLKYLGLRHFAGDTPYQILLAPIPPRFKFCFCKVSWAKIIDGDAYHPGLRRWCLPAARVLRGDKGIAQRQHHLVIPNLVHSLLSNTLQSMWVTVGDCGWLYKDGTGRDTYILLDKDGLRCKDAIQPFHPNL